MVKPLLDAIAIGPTHVNSAPLYFCTDETSQTRKAVADMLAAESGGAGTGVGAGAGAGGKGYGVEWCVAAVEAGGGDLDKAREWLRNWAPKTGEMIVR